MISATAFAPRGLRTHLRVPVLRSGYALVASSLATSALGAVYWFVAAHRYDTRSVGIGSSLVAATTLLAGIANLGLKNGLLRFVPQAGGTTGRLIRNSYALTAVCATLAGSAFLVGVRVWSPDLAFLRDGPAPLSIFLITLVAWSLFIIQDSALVGLGQAMWVPVENIVFSAAKIAMLLGLAYAAPRWGVFLSWSIPTVVLIVAVNLAIARVWLPRHVARASDATPPTFVRVLRFSLADQVATLLWLATLDGLPLLVLRRAGASAAAYYYVSAQIAYGLYVVSGCIGAALLSEAARDPGRLAELNRRVSRQAFALVVPTTVAVVIAAPWVLRVFGPAYEDNGTSLLRLLALSALPYTVTSIALSRARVRQQMTVVVVGHAAIFVLCVGLAAYLQPDHGLSGIGAGVLLGQSAVAAAVLLVASLRVIQGAQGLASLGRIRNRARHLHATHRLKALLARIDLPEELRSGQARLLSAQNDAIVVELAGRHKPVVVKMATGRRARFGLIDHVGTLRALHADPRLAVMAETFPRVVREGTATGLRFVAETRCLGAANSDALLDVTRRPAALRAVGAYAARLHSLTAREAEVDEELFHRWVGRPLELMSAAVGTASADFARGSAALADELHSVLLGQRVAIARVHGDLTPGNVLLDGEGRRVTGLVDWERSRHDGLPGADLAMFVLALRREATGAELGNLVLKAADGSLTLDSDEAAFLHGDADSGAVPGGTPLSDRHLVLLAWLAHAESNLVKGERYRVSRRWLRRNVIAVVEGLSFPEVAGSSATVIGRAALKPVSWARLPRAIDQAAKAVGGLGTIGVLAGATMVWLWGLSRVDIGAMTDVGLVSVMPAFAWVGVAAVVVAVVHSLTRPSLNERRLLVLISGYIVMIHATTPVLYRTLRYSWAWKHVGIVDYIGRHGSVNPRISALSVYHNWPGFFSANAALVDLIGTKNAVVFALWAPVVVNLLDLSALLLLLPTLGGDRRVVWTAVWLFFLTNWVGQDYFAPQAMAYFLHLVILALVLRHFRRVRRNDDDIAERAIRPGAKHREPRCRAAVGTGLVVLALAITSISSHQVTPGMMLVVMALLVASRRIRAAWVVLAAFIGQVLWLLGPARTFAAKNLASTLRSFGAPVENAGATLRDTARQSAGQAFVSLAGRGVVVLIAVLALIGVVVRLRRGHRDGRALILLCSPVLLVVANEFGGEILFRAYLFSIPFLALFAAWALLPSPVITPNRLHTVTLAAVSLLLFFGFAMAHFGKDRHYRFSKNEVSASTFLANNAVAPTLLVEGNGNYPGKFLNYEKFVYVPITEEPPDSVRTILADPAVRLEAWLADPRYARAYILITRSQKADADAEGTLPVGALDRLEGALRGSPKFAMAFENSDAVVFTLAPADPTPTELKFDEAPPEPELLIWS